jgi:hypothetical protein
MTPLEIVAAQEREVRYLRVRKWALGLSCAVGAAMILSELVPGSRGLALGTGVVAMLFLCAYVAVEAARGFRSERWSPLIGAAVISMVFGMLALRDAHLVASGTLVIAAFLASLPLAFVLARCVLERRWWTVGGIALMMIGYTGGALALGNVLLDEAAGEHMIATVEAKQVRRGKGVTYHLTLAGGAATRAIDASEVRVDGDVYEAVQQGGDVCVRVRPGAFGFAWFKVVDAEQCPTAQ